MLVGLAVGVTAGAAPAGASVPARTKLERSISRTIHKMINEERTAHGLAPVRMSPKLQLAARRHNLHMAHDNTMSHQLPGEPYFGRRILNAGYRWSYAGENIAWNSDMTRSGVKLLERLMYHEKAPYNDHRLNILSRHYKGVGVDVYMDKSNNKVWLTTDFARHRWQS
ncbi:MAG TPA: CAP domain-containing protein [Jatrophihabitans sp.]|nr:CAP domain-containing protein [Jatrophihabitans sp.]